ncbi:MAG TPA: glycosyltransferase [Tepidisphaeraceae bacterium]|nr:glycosyltransferase [Tepidisphaeraceae bacterium]
MSPGRRYCLITPCRDEARYARRTIDAVLRQTVQPALWVIVDDGSRDETPAILQEYAQKVPWIRVVRRADRGERKLGGGVIDAFYSGYETINPSDFDYICKFDLDLDLPPLYFESIIQRMEDDARIGTCSGKPYFRKPAHGGADHPPAKFPISTRDGFISEKCGDENSVGMIKFYRTACFKQIGGFVRMLMWDGIDCHRCRMTGWVACSWEDPELRFEHLRPMGTSHKSWWTGRVRHGVGQWYMGTSPAYMLASAAYRMTRPPLVLGGVAMLWGYARSWLSGAPRYGDPEFRQFLRAYQWDCLRRGKKRATAAVNTRQATKWSSGNSSLPPAGAAPAVS